MAIKPKKSGSAKTESVTIRLNPRLRFGLELLARKQRRSTTSVIEWAIDQALEREDFSINNESASGVDATNNIWDVFDSDRLVKLAIYYPQLLTYEEEVTWKIIREIKEFWYGNGDYYEDGCDFQTIRKFWPEIKAVADGEKNLSELQQKLSPPNAPTKNGFDEFDNDVPF